MDNIRENTKLWDPAEHLKTKEDMIAYIEAALEDGDTSIIASVLGDVARAESMTEIAAKTGLSRTSLYRALSPEGRPEFETILKVIDALDLKLRVTQKEPRQEEVNA
jgi:probable addiction module antidote protein